jgi:hypothetical protein
MKIALLGTGFGRAHAAVFADRSDVDEVVVLGRTPERPAGTCSSSCRWPPPSMTRTASSTSSSALMPQPYGMRGGWRATFTDGVLEYAMRADFTGQGPTTLTEYTTTGDRAIDLPAPSPLRGDDPARAVLHGR